MLVPAEIDGKAVWRIGRVKASTRFKGEHRDDVAVQPRVARCAGVPLQPVSLPYIDSNWVYPSDADYRGPLREEDWTVDAFGREDEVVSWIADAHAIAQGSIKPIRGTGSDCSAPLAAASLMTASARNHRQPTRRVGC